MRPGGSNRAAILASVLPFGLLPPAAARARRRGETLAEQHRLGCGRRNGELGYRRNTIWATDGTPLLFRRNSM